MNYHKFIKTIITVIILLFIAIVPVKAQYCSNFHESNNCKLSTEGGWKYYGQSKSAMLEINKTYNYKMVLYGEKDFKIAICTEVGFGTVHYRILNARSNNVLYDNISDDYMESIGFTNDFTQSVIFEVEIVAEESEIEGAYEKRGCIGINILWRKVPRLGF